VRTSTGSPTKAERERWALFPRVGCITCLLRFGEKNPLYEIHHILQGNKRLGHWYSLPLCTSHHRIPGLGPWTSIANGRRAYQRVHGTELDQWLKLQHMLNLSDELPSSKLVPRRVPGSKSFG